MVGEAVGIAAGPIVGEIVGPIVGIRVGLPVQVYVFCPGGQQAALLCAIIMHTISKRNINLDRCVCGGESFF